MISLATLRSAAEDVVTEAVGRSHRDDPVVGATGGPAGNARLTAWIGLALLVLFAAEVVTLLDVRSLINWHVVIGVVLIPPALVKTASTGWRIVRYYTGDRTYRTAGPPPMLLRILGPLVVATTLGVLGTGVALVVVGPDRARASVALLGHAVDLVMLHKATFVLWGAATGVHTLARLVPAWRLVGSKIRVPGRGRRIAVLAAAALVTAATGILGLNLGSAWHNDIPFEHHRDGAQFHTR